MAKADSTNSKRKLTDAQEADLIRRYLAGELTRTIAESYGICHQTVHNILVKHKIAKLPIGDQIRRVWDHKRINDGMSATLRHYHRSKERGNCVSCGKPSPGFRLCKKCREGKTSMRRLRVANGLCEDCGKLAEPNSSHCTKHKAENRARYYAAKEAAFLAYGGFVCACCGETEPVFLCLDHVNGDGADQRRKLGKSTMVLFRWLKNHGYPPGLFQVLCHNCNMGKHLGGCPHKRQRTTEIIS
jgi:hypothetical protein